MLSSGVCSPRHRGRAPTPTCPHLCSFSKLRKVQQFLPGRADCSTAVFSTVRNPTQVFLLPTLFSPGSCKSSGSHFTCSTAPPKRDKKWVLLRGCSWVKRTGLEMVGEDHSPVLPQPCPCPLPTQTSAILSIFLILLQKWFKTEQKKIMANPSIF